MFAFAKSISPYNLSATIYKSSILYLYEAVKKADSALN